MSAVARALRKELKLLESKLQKLQDDINDCPIEELHMKQMQLANYMESASIQSWDNAKLEKQANEIKALEARVNKNLNRNITKDVDKEFLLKKEISEIQHLLVFRYSE